MNIPYFMSHGGGLAIYCIGICAVIASRADYTRKGIDPQLLISYGAWMLTGLLFAVVSLYCRPFLAECIGAMTVCWFAGIGPLARIGRFIRFKRK